MKLSQKKCAPCEDKAGIAPLDHAAAEEYLKELKGWTLDHKATAISKDFEFKDFLKSMAFVEQVADIAQESEHHPDIHIWYNKVKLELSTHSIGGLTENDFIVAARIDELWLI